MTSSYLDSRYCKNSLLRHKCKRYQRGANNVIALTNSMNDPNVALVGLTFEINVEDSQSLIKLFSLII